MPVTLYYMSGSPYAWRVWLALEHRTIPYELKIVSYDDGDLSKPEFVALNPRRRVPVLRDDDFSLSESAAIVEYLSDKWPGEPLLFAGDLRQRAVQRRMIREIDQYVGEHLERLVHAILFTPREQRSDERIAKARAGLKAELAMIDAAITDKYLAGPLSAVDFTLFPYLALVERMGMQKPGLAAPDLMGTRLSAWTERMRDLPITRKTWPPHWK